MAIGAILGLIGTIIATIIANAHNSQINQQQYEQQQELMGMQYRYNEQAAENAQERTIGLYKETQSPAAMRQQLEDAGMSIGMMYGGSGMGGQLQQGAQGSGVSIPSRTVLGMSPVFNSQDALTSAKIEETQANIALKESEAAKNWKDIPLKEKQLIVMENKINETKANIELMNEQVKTEVEKQINLAKDSNKKEKEAEYTEALKDYTVSQQQIAEKLATAQEQEIIALAEQHRASARKLNVEAATLEQTMKYTVQSACYEAAMKHIELIKAPLEVGQAEAEMNKLIEEAYEHGVDNQMYKKIEEKFGKTTASVIKNGAEMISIVLKGVGSAVMKVPVPKP